MISDLVVLEVLCNMSGWEAHALMESARHASNASIGQRYFRRFDLFFPTATQLQPAASLQELEHYHPCSHQSQCNVFQKVFDLAVLLPHHFVGPHQSILPTTTLPVPMLPIESSGLTHSPMPVHSQPLMAARPDRLRVVAICANV